MNYTTLKFVKTRSSAWMYYPNSYSIGFTISKGYFVGEETSGLLQIVEDGRSKRPSVPLSGVSVVDQTGDNVVKTFTTFSDLTQLLMELGCPLVDSGNSGGSPGPGPGGTLLYTVDFPVAIAPGKSVGRYVNGDIIPAAGKTIDQVMTLITQERLFPTLMDPRVTILHPGTPTRFEIGTSLTFDATLNFTKGSILGKDEAGVWNPVAIQGPRSGDASAFVMDGTVYPSEVIKITRNIVAGDNDFVGLVRYGQGPQPVDSSGFPLGLPLPAGTVTSTLTFQGLKKVFFGNTASTPTTSAQVRALASNQFADVVDFQINLSTKKFSIAIPSNLTLSNVTTANNENVTGNFTLASFNVSDAGSGTNPYKIYTLTTAVPLGLTATVKLT